MKKTLFANVAALLSVSAVSLAATGEALRISSIMVDLSKPTELHLSPGLACQIKFREEVGDVTSGSPEDVMIIRSPSEPKRVTLMLKTARARATNLFIIVGGKTFVFDLIPSGSEKGVHQDLVEIVGSFGNPPFQDVSTTHPSTKKGGV